MTIKEIIKNKYVKWEDVKRAIKYHYPTDKNNYEDLFYSLAKKKALPVSKNDFLVVEGGIKTDTEWFKKYGKKFLKDLSIGDEEQYYAINIDKRGDDMSWSCSFVPWGQMINIPIHPKTLEYFTMVDIVAHFIWEITFYGDEKEMSKHAKELLKTCKEIKAGEAKTVPIDEILKNKK